MARFNPIQTSFVAGEFSPRLEARSDLQNYQFALRQTMNGVVLPHGGFQRRSGSRFVSEVKDSSTGAILQPFVPSVGEGIVIELGKEYMRFYQNGIQLTDNSGNPVEVTTPFQEDELRDVQFAQSVDVAWVVHPFYFPRLLKRTGTNPTTFTFEKVEFRSGHAPLRRPNPDLENPLVVSNRGSNPRTLTWKNNPVEGGLDTSGDFDINRAIRLDDGQTVAWYRITNVTAANQADADLMGGNDPTERIINSKKNDNPLQLETDETDHGLVEGEVIFFVDPSGNTVIDPTNNTDFFIVGPNVLNNSGEIILNQFQVNSFPDNMPVDGSGLSINGDEAVFRAPTDWAVGMFSDEEGPRAVTFHEGRLAYGGGRVEIDRVHLSVVEDFNNFELTTKTFDLTDAEAADRAIERRVLSTENNVVQWLQAANRKLFVGTSGGEFVIRGENNDLLTPTGAQVIQATARGSIHLQPAVIDNQIVFVQQNAETLRRLRFDIQADGQVAEDISILAEHILDSGIVDLAYQQSPDSVLWTVRDDGVLVGWTIEAQQEVTAAHRHVLGGNWSGKEAVVESVAAIPSPPGINQNQVWVTVKRTVNGVLRRYVEFFEESYQPRTGFDATETERIRAIEDGVFVDSSLSLDNPIAVSDITNDTKATVTTATDHGLSPGDTIRFRDAVGMEEINQVTAEVDSVNTTTEFVAKVDTSSFGDYRGFGTIRKEFTSFSGMDHLEGETVQVLADGAVHPDRTINNGGFNLDRAASIVHVGLRYPYRMETVRYVTNLAVGTTQGQKARIQRVNLRLHESMGGRVAVGPRPTEQDFGDIILRQASLPMDRAIPLFTGDKEIPVPGGWTTEPTILIEQEQPLPLTVLGIMPRMEANER